MGENYIVKPVVKALQVLEYVAEEGRELALTEICYQVKMPTTTVFRYLKTLQKEGYIAYDPKSDRYRTGARLWALAQLPGSQSFLREIALPTMRSLRDRFNETINLAELDGKEVVYIEMMESRRSLRMQAKIGAHDPAYCTAVGKAMLAFLPEEHWSDHLPAELTARTPHTIASHDAILEELAEIRRCGYALDKGENEEGACCIGAPILNGNGQSIAGLSLSAPASRLSATLEKEIARAMVQAAAEISSRLAHRSTSDH